MKSTSLKLIVIFSLILGYAFATNLFAQDDAAEPQYIGSKKCKICHKGEKNGMIWETWEDGVHAKAMESLSDEEKTNPECLKCHTTGYGMGGYGAEGMEDVDLAHVGCESCHGAGSEYKSKKVMEDREASIAAGMIVPTAETCMQCHNEESPTFKGFDFDEYWARIKHELPAEEEEAAGEE